MSILFQICSVIFLLCLRFKCITNQLQDHILNLNHGSQSLLRAVNPEGLNEKYYDKRWEKTVPARNTDVLKILNYFGLLDAINIFTIKARRHVNTLVHISRLPVLENNAQHNNSEQQSFVDQGHVYSYKAQEKENLWMNEKQHSGQLKSVKQRHYYGYKPKLKQSKTFDDKAREDAYRKSNAAEYPYAVGFLFWNQDDLSGMCSGSLLTPEWVLTAAHCLDGMKVVQVFAGLLNMTDTVITDEIPEHAQTVVSDELYCHPDYDPKNVNNDYGLIRLSDPFNLTEYAKPVRLSTEPWTHRGYRNCVVTGFGNVRMYKDSPDDKVRKTHVLEAKKPCLCDFKLEQILGIEVTNKFICTRNELDLGHCPGDSGSSLVCDGEIKAVASLIISFSNLLLCRIIIPFAFFQFEECGGEHLLNVYQDTCPVLRWINGHVKLFNDSEIAPGCMAGRGAVGKLHTHLLYAMLVFYLLVFC